MSDIVLLPGTTSGQNGYERFAVALHRRGWDVHGIDLPTDRPGWVAADYATLVADRLGRDVTAPVVLGHSGAGLLIDPVARMLGGRHAVWLAAYIPAQGISLSDENLNAVFNSEWLGVDGIRLPPTTSLARRATRPRRR